MTIDDKIKDKKLQYDITREAVLNICQKHLPCHQAIQKTMNILQVMKYYLVIKNK